MRLNRALLLLSLLGVFAMRNAHAEEPVPDAISNWPAPAVWSPHGAGRGLSTMGVITGALPFIGVTPCRVADTRGNGFAGQYGPPALVANATRTFTIVGQCSIPASAAAVSFNFGALNVGGAGDLRVFPAGGGVPLVSTLNYNASTPNIANAAVVALSPGGAITVQTDAVPIDLIIDVNGYYGNPTGDLSNLFLGPVAGNTTLTGQNNVGIGTGALQSLTTGFNNTAVGTDALLNDTTGYLNTAFGTSALRANQGGAGNTAVGHEALLLTNAGGNTAIGDIALHANSDGVANVAIGAGALQNISSGNSNIAIGYIAASSLTSGSANIHIGNVALSSESHTIRIGTGGGVHTKFFVAGVRDVTTGQADGVPVYIDGLAQLGTISSSARVKKEIADIGEESSAILKLRPVSFLYRHDALGIRQYGLIAEEVAAVMPELVQFSEAGEPEMVRYHFLTPILLKELQKQRKTIDQQNDVIEGLEQRLNRIEARLMAEPGR